MPVGVAPVGHQAHRREDAWVMLARLTEFAFIAAMVLIVVAGGLVARADWSVAPRGRGGALERLWVALPAGFLVLLIVLVGRDVW